METPARGDRRAERAMRDCPTGGAMARPWRSLSRVVRSARRGEAVEGEPCPSRAGGACDGSATQPLVPSRRGPRVGLRGLPADRVGHRLVLVRRRAHPRSQWDGSDPALRGSPRPPRARREPRAGLAMDGSSSDRNACGGDWRGQLRSVHRGRDLDPSRDLPVAIACCHGASRGQVRAAVTASRSPAHAAASSCRSAVERQSPPRSRVRTYARRQRGV